MPVYLAGMGLNYLGISMANFSPNGQKLLWRKFNAEILDATREGSFPLN
ncbi:MAG: hypothetical protein IPN56_15870 [Chitinophagaceae bacterium]|nr:hypothetical protein [Chitinophagaceae bacterium]